MAAGPPCAEGGLSRAEERLSMALPILSVRDFSHRFVVDRTLSIDAVSHLSLEIEKGEIYGLVGESGCGKSTLARAVAGLYPVTSGEIWFRGLNIADKGVLRRHRDEIRQGMQIIFQDSAAALDPRMSVEELVAEPLEIRRLFGDRAGRRREAARLLDMVGLAASTSDKRPGELSGGQRQRVAVARAVAARPELVVADEPVASLDVSMQAQIVTLFQQLREENGFSFLFISHDLAMMRYVCDRIGVMYAGRLVEEAAAEELFSDPLHPYTQALLSAMPEADPVRDRARVVLSFEDKGQGNVFSERRPGHKVLC